MRNVETDKHCRVMVVAGESSGDLHGSNLIKAASVYPNMEFFGVGGDKMQAAGCQIVFSADELAVMGVVEVLSQLPKIYRRFKQLKQILNSTKRPDLLILIDFPDFNLRLAKVAKAAGVSVLYYISPKVWAWRSSRAKVIADRVDGLALIFPFEVPIYESLGVNAKYVGNPLLDEFKINKPQGLLRNRLGIKAEEEVVGIFPGSRNSELQYILNTLIETAKLIYHKRPATKFILPVALSLSRELIQQKFESASLPISFVEENIYETASACDAVLTVSGTVTLQIALVGTPMAILYKVAPLSYAIGKHLIKVDHVGLPNIVVGKTVVREFIQDDATPKQLYAEIEHLLSDTDYRSQMIADLASVRECMGEAGCSLRVAKMANELISQTIKGDES